MGRTKSVTAQTAPKQKIRPALTPEAQEQLGISLAMDLAMQQLQDGTASAQVITHFLKLGTEKARLENEKLQAENELTKAKKVALESEERMAVLYENAIKAMQRYSGNADEPEEGPDEYDDY